MTMGGFPYITQAHLQDEMINMYMEGIYNTILVKAIEERINRKQQELNPKNITDVSLLKAISKYLSSVLGSPVSIRVYCQLF